MTPRVEQMGSRLFRLPLPRPWGGHVREVHLVVTELRDTDGRVGVGFSWTPTIGARAIHALLEYDIRDAVLGGSTEAGPVWDHVWTHLHEAGGAGLTTIAMSALDLALWDLQGRASGRALPDMVGRRRDCVAVYGSGVNLHYTLEQLVDQAHRWVSSGVSAVKIKVGNPDLDDDLERVAAVRSVIGDERLLMLDANQRWDLPTAVRAIRRLERFDPYWIEEPLLSDDIGAHVRLRSKIGVPVAVGESYYTSHQFRDLLTAGACDIVQPNVVRVGGVTPFLRIADLARTFAAPVAPHLLPDISAQLAACLPVESMVEDVEDASLDALGALSEPSGVKISAGVADVSAVVEGHGLNFATDRMQEISNI